jgi:hypothetical protein
MAFHHCAIFVGALTVAFAAVSSPASAATAKRCQMTRGFSNGWFVKLNVSNEGGTCSTELSYMGNSQHEGRHRIVPASGEITSAPRHGTARQIFDPTDPRLEYTPTAGYTGTDHFEMRFPTSTWLWSVDVTVGP